MLSPGAPSSTALGNSGKERTVDPARLSADDLGGPKMQTVATSTAVNPRVARCPTSFSTSAGSVPVTVPVPVTVTVPVTVPVTVTVPVPVPVPVTVTVTVTVSLPLPLPNPLPTSPRRSEEAQTR